MPALSGVTTRTGPYGYLTIRGAAIDHFSRQEANDLSFAAGETIVVVSEKNGDWWLGRARGKEGLFPANHVEKLESTALAPAPATGRLYRPFGAALHGTDTPPQNGVGVNSVGLQQAPGQPEKKSKYGAMGNTVIGDALAMSFPLINVQMAHAAVGGVGFGAGGFSITADTDVDLKWPVRCCDRWRFGERNLLSSWTLYYVTYITWTELRSASTTVSTSTAHFSSALPCIANQYIFITYWLTSH